MAGGGVRVFHFCVWLGLGGSLVGLGGFGGRCQVVWGGRLLGSGGYPGIWGGYGIWDMG